MQNLLKISTLLALPLILSACASSGTQPDAPAEAVRTTAVAITPDYECAFFFGQLDDIDKLTDSIDKAVTVAENNGLSISQTTGIYGQVKKDARARVLDRAIEMAATSTVVVPRLDGSVPPPNAAVELAAWKDLFEQQCEG